MDARRRNDWCFDLEFEAHTGTVQEIAIINYHSGEVILNAILKEGQTLERAKKRSRVLDNTDDDPEKIGLFRYEGVCVEVECKTHATTRVVFCIV